MSLPPPQKKKIGGIPASPYTTGVYDHAICIKPTELNFRVGQVAHDPSLFVPRTAKLWKNIAVVIECEIYTIRTHAIHILVTFKHTVIFIFGCCILLHIYPTGSLWRRQSQQSFNTLTHFYFLSHPLRVSAPTGHLQVRYTIRYFNGLFLIQRIRCTYAIWCRDVICCTSVLILQFYIYNFYIYIQLITCIRTTSWSTDVQQITSLYQIAYAQRIRCIQNSPLKQLIVYLTWRWPVGAETCSEWERK
jgi:hypothetical protein